MLDLHINHGCSVILMFWPQISSCHQNVVCVLNVKFCLCQGGQLTFFLPEQDDRPLKGLKIFKILLMGQAVDTILKSNAKYAIIGDYEYQFVLTICFIS